ncbi:MAG: FAD:protein FMN transferase [Flavobacteriales bacterium]|nr:FAD:protein FMN transferase [Flavobacteriales bacterium]
MSAFNGYVQGTTFHITYDFCEDAERVQKDIDSLFRVIDESMSLYDSTSLLSKVNRMTDTAIMVDEHFYNVFTLSKKINRESEGAFNPALYPLIQYWGFGAGNIPFPEQTPIRTIDSLKALCDFSGFSMEVRNDGYLLIKRKPYLRLDFNAIAQGYTVDVIADYFQLSGIENYMIEVGGEVRTAGVNHENKPWRIGIDKPVAPDQPRELIAIANLSNRSLATSGSYRKFYMKNGTKYSHTIDPGTGYPVQHNLISVSFFAPTAAEADGYATACMVMGMEKAKAMIKEIVNADIYLIYADYKGNLQMYMSDNLRDSLEMLKKESTLSQ